MTSSHHLKEVIVLLLLVICLAKTPYKSKLDFEVPKLVSRSLSNYRNKECRDTILPSSCADIKNQGQCREELQICNKTCGYCLPECRDTLLPSSCADIKKQGLCSEEVPMCNKTCGYCSQGTDQLPTTREKKCPICGKANEQYFRNWNNRMARVPELNHKYPWLVFIQSVIEGMTYNCGGQIINSRWVLTAAHCFYDGSDAGCNYIKKAEVHVGLHRTDFNDGILGVTRIIQVKDFIKHSGYQCGISHNDDIGLLGLEEDLDLFSTFQSKGIGAICLPKDDEGWFEGEDAVAAGWGVTASKRSKNFADKPFEVTRRIQRKFCSNYRSSWITDNMICAEAASVYKIQCTGDSGGPLIVKNENDTYVLAGITSFWPASGNCNGPLVYTRVNQYLEWIADHTKDIPCNMLHAD